MNDQGVMVITGTRKGIGRYLAEHYAARGYRVVGCSRCESDLALPNYEHFCLDVSDEEKVTEMLREVGSRRGRLDVLINNAGIACMNQVLLTPVSTVRRILDTNVVGTFLVCREAAKVMARKRFGRIVNLTTVATALDLEGEAIYAASKAAVEQFTRVLAREVADMGITVNAVGPAPVKTDLIKGVPEAKIRALIRRQAIQRHGELRDVRNVIDFFLKRESDFVTGQIVYLGGV